MLDRYLQRTQLLLTDPLFEVFNEGDLTNWINMARGQIAGDSECIRVMGTLPTTAAQQQYSFATISLGGLTSSVLGVLNVRQITYTIASGAKSLHSRSFPWFNTYILSQPVPTPGPPTVWSQFGQGALGTIYTNVLDGNYTLNLDTVCYPVDLVDDTTPEAIPYQWTDAIPFYAAYYAALTVGAADKAKAMFDEYSKFIVRARGAATPSVLPGNFAQPADPFIGNRLGLQTKGGQ